MTRAFSVAACLLAATMLLPASAEAKRRFGGGSRAVAPPAVQPKPKSSLIVVPVGLGTSRARASQTAAPERVPFPPTAAQQVQPATAPTRQTAEVEKTAWCRSDVVVGGFCMIN